MSRGPGALVIAFFFTAAFPVTSSLQTPAGALPGPQIQEPQPAGTPRMGEYVVSGTLRQPMFQQGANPNDSREGFAPTYYPGTLDPGAAGVVAVGLGQETSIQLALQASRMARVSGTITDSAGRPLTGVTVMLRSQSGPGMMFNGGATGPDGSFTLSNVPPGEHVIDVAAQTRTPEAPETASVALTVGSQDITDTPYQLRASQNIDGLRIVLTDRVTEVSGASPENGALRSRTSWS